MKKKQLVKSVKPTFNVAKPLCSTHKGCSGSVYADTGGETDILL